MANVEPFPIPTNLPLLQTPPSAEGHLHDFPYREGFRSGYLDACMHYTSRYASVLFGTDLEWQRSCSHGYTDGQRAKREEREV